MFPEPGTNTGSRNMQREMGHIRCSGSSSWASAGVLPPGTRGPTARPCDEAGGGGGDAVRRDSSSGEHGGVVGGVVAVVVRRADGGGVDGGASAGTASAIGRAIDGVQQVSGALWQKLDNCSSDQGQSNMKKI